MPKCHFNKGTLAWVFSCKFTAYFQNLICLYSYSGPCQVFVDKTFSSTEKKNSQTFFPVGRALVVENVVDFDLVVVTAVEALLREMFAVVSVVVVFTTFFVVDVCKVVAVVQEVCRCSTGDSVVVNVTLVHSFKSSMKKTLIVN